MIVGGDLHECAGVVGFFDQLRGTRDSPPSRRELLDYIDQWAAGQVGDFDLLDCIDLWAVGHYYWDEASSMFKPGYE